MRVKESAPPEAVTALAAFPGRGAGTDAERRAARWLADQLKGTCESTIEPFWCRPNWALAQSWHVMLALAGSLTSIASPQAGGAMLLAALVCVLADALGGVSPGRRLSPERASQNVVALARRRSTALAREPTPRSAAESPLHLIITANYDAGRMGLPYRDAARSMTSRLRRSLHGLTPGWLGWLSVAIVWLLLTTILRLEGHTSRAVAGAQLVPTVALVLTLALLLETAASNWSPAAGDNGSGVSVAIALARTLSVSPPRHLHVEVVLSGAGDGAGIGLRHHLRARRRTHRPDNTVVIGIAPCAEGQPRWWRSDGSLVPLRYGGRLVELARQVAGQAPQLRGKSHAGRGSTPALPARQARIPAITIGCLDERDIVPRSHQPSDVAPTVSRRAHDQSVQFGLMLVDAIDVALHTRIQQSA